MSKKKIKGVSKTLKLGEKQAPELDLAEISREADAQGPLTPEEMKRWGITAPGMADDLEPWEQETDPWEVSEDKDPWEVETTSDPYQVTGKGLIKGAVESLPTAGMLFGGAAGAPLGPVGILGGAALGAAGGKATENFIESRFMDEPKSRVELYGDPIAEGVKGAASEAGGQIAGKAYGFLRGMGQKSTPITVGDLSGKNYRVPQPERYTPMNEGPRDFSEMGFSKIPKDNADDIALSAVNLGTKATPGMLSANPNIQNIENILSQKPTIYGEKVRQSYKPVFNALKNTSEELVEAPMSSRLSTGDRVKQGLIGKVRAKSEPLSRDFENIRQSTPHIQPDPKNLNRSADRLMKQPLAEVPELATGKIISKYSDMVRGAKSLDTLKRIRTEVNEEITSAYMSGRGSEAMALKKVKDSINRLERREIIKSAMANTPTPLQGEKAAKSLIDQMKKTNKGWAVMMTELQKVAKAGGMRSVSSPGHFIKLIEEMPSEKLAQRMFNTKNYQGLKDVKKFAPEEFEMLRHQRLNEIAQKSKVADQIDPGKLIKALESEGPEARSLLFGPKAETVLKDLKNVLHSIPKKVGGSDTPRGTMWSKFADNPWNVINPWVYGPELGNAYSYILLQGGALATIQTGAAQTARGLLSPAKSSAGLLMMKNRGRESEE